MPSRFKIVLTAERPNPEKPRAVDLLADLTGASTEEAEFWINHLPHTVTQNASRVRAQMLLKQFSELGFVVDTQPALLSREETAVSHKPEAMAAGENLALTSAASGSNKGLYLSIGIIGVIAVLFTVSLLLVYGYLRKTFKPEQQNAEELIRRGHYEQAQSILTRKIEGGKGGANEYLNRGIARISRIRLAGSRRNWNKHLTSADWESGMERIRNYFVTREGNAALADLENAVKLEPDNPNAYKWLGILLRERREFIRAEKAFGKALVLSPGHIELLNFLGSVFIDQFRYGRADSVLTLALRNAPDHPATLKNMGNLQLHYRNDTAKALRYYLKYMNQDAGMDFDRHVIRQDITRIFWNKYFGMPLNRRNEGMPFRDFETNRVKLMEMLKSDKSADLYWELGKLFARRGMYPEAEIQWLQALKISPGQSGIINSLFRVQGAMGHFPQAAGTLRNAIKNKAATPEMFMALGLLNKYYTENKKDAILNFQRYLKQGKGRFSSDALTELQELKGR